MDHRYYSRILFLIDTSASMNARFELDMVSYLETAKSIAENIMEMGKHNPRYKFMLMTYDESPKNIVTDFNDERPTTLNAIKRLEATETGDGNMSLYHVFDYLNLERLCRDLDTPGFGRFPHRAEPTVIIWLTDCGKLNVTQPSMHRINIPGLRTFSLPIYTGEPFRWDQRLYTIAIGNHADPDVLNDCRTMSEATGGALWELRLPKLIRKCCENILGLGRPHVDILPFRNVMQHGVVVRFEQLSDEGNPAYQHPQSPASLLYTIPARTGVPMHYPIPESYFPQPNVDRLELRPAIPILYYKQSNEPVHIGEFFSDKFILERGSPLDREMRSKGELGTTWRVYAMNPLSKKYDVPYGILRWSTSGSQDIYFCLLPWNFTVLFELLDRLGCGRGAGLRKPDAKWTSAVKDYVAKCPVYYYAATRKQFDKYGLGQYFPSMAQSAENTYSSSLGRKIPPMQSQAKAELERLQLLKKEANELQKTIQSTRVFEIDVAQIPRLSILNELSKMKSAFNSFAQLGARDEDYHKHSKPTSEMGEYVLVTNKLRDPLESDAQRRAREKRAFGSPYAGVRENEPQLPPHNPIDSDGEMLNEGAIELHPSLTTNNRRRKQQRVFYSHFPDKSEHNVPPLSDKIILIPGPSNTISWESMRNGRVSQSLNKQLVGRKKALKSQKEVVKRLFTPHGPTARRGSILGSAGVKDGKNGDASSVADWNIISDSGVENADTEMTDDVSENDSVVFGNLFGDEDNVSVVETSSAPAPAIIPPSSNGHVTRKKSKVIEIIDLTADDRKRELQEDESTVQTQRRSKRVRQ